MKGNAPDEKKHWRHLGIFNPFSPGATTVDPLQPWKIISKNNSFIVYLSVLLFALYAFTGHGLNVTALLTSLIASVPVGFAVAFFETQAMEFRRKHRRTGFWVYLLYRTLRITFWILVLFFFIMNIVRWLPINTRDTIFPETLYDFFATQKLLEFLGLSLVVSLVSNFMDELHRKLGKDAIFNLVFGKYHQVKQEQRIFLFIDLNKSTDIAEEMGEMEYSHFLQDYFYDISEPVARYGGSVYQYVGDEIVVTWPLKKGMRSAVCVRCFFAIQKQLKRYQDQYMKRYGRLPEFKGSLHGGQVVVSEVGKYKSEIAYHGDVLNTAARVLGKCHELNAIFIISDWVMNHVAIPKYLKLDTLGIFQLKGKQQELELFSVYLQEKQEKKEKGKGLFRKRPRFVDR